MLSHQLRQRLIEHTCRAKYFSKRLQWPRTFILFGSHRDVNIFLFHVYLDFLSFYSFYLKMCVCSLSHAVGPIRTWAGRKRLMMWCLVQQKRMWLNFFKDLLWTVKLLTAAINFLNGTVYINYWMDEYLFFTKTLNRNEWIFRSFDYSCLFNKKILTSVF